MAADYVGDVIGEAQLPEGLCPDFIVLDDANAGHLSAFDGPDVPDVVEEGGDDFLLVSTVFSGEVGCLQRMFKLRDLLAVVLRLSGCIEKVENAVGGLSPGRKSLRSPLLAIVVSLCSDSVRLSAQRFCPLV